MCIEIFRYAGQAEFCRVNLPRPTRRAPGNVPYLIDNLWEWMRPERMPNRRHAVFASPTANLAMEGAGAPAGNETNVGIVEFVGVANVAQVSVSDARMHPDVRTLRNVVLGYFLFRELRAQGLDSLYAVAYGRALLYGLLACSGDNRSVSGRV